MPVSPNIYSLVQQPQLQNTLLGGQEFAIRQEAAERAQEEQPLRSRLLEAQAGMAEQAYDEGEQRSIVMGALGAQQFLNQGDTAGLRNYLQKRVDAGPTSESGQVRGMSDTQELINMIDSGATADDLRALVDPIVEFGKQSGILGSAAQLTGPERERQALMKDLEGAVDPETGKLKDRSELTARQENAAIGLNLLARPVGSAMQTITERGTAQDVAKSEAIVAEGRKFGELTGESRANAIDDGFESIKKSQQNIANLDRAVEALDQGANTGAIENTFFPTIKAATVSLNQIQNELTLDVLNAATFGALSEEELKLAKQTALPTNLPEDELRKFLNDKKAAQEKLISYFEEQIDFLDQGGTVAGFVRMKKRQQEARDGIPKTTESTQDFGGFKILSVE